MEEKNIKVASMEVQDGNRIIAEFMGGTQNSETGQYFFREHPNRNIIQDGSGLFVLQDDMPYHTSWDWLMPVVRKICDDNVMGSISNTIKWLRSGGRFNLLEWDSIEDVWFPVVKYLKHQKQLSP